MGRRHPLAFRDGESRFVFAAWRDGSAGLVEMPDGGAELWRSRAAELMCPVPGCPTPDIVVVNRGARRHGFAHRAGGDHSPESLNHVQGKALLVRWATSTHPDAIVVEEHPSNAARERVADVMVSFPDGRRIALEVQYSALEVDKWQERHDSYRRQGILDVWFFGHDGAQASSVGDDGVSLNAVQATAAAHAPVVWLNPIVEHVGYPVVSRWSGARSVEMLQSAGTGELRTESIGSLHIGTMRVESALLDELTARAESWRAEEAKRAERERAAAARREVEAQRDEEEKQRVAAEAMWFIERQQLLLEEWVVTSEYAEALEGLGGIWPRTLSEPSASAAKTQFPALMWQWLIWDRVIRPLVPNEEATIAAAISVLDAEFGGRGGNARVVRHLAGSFLGQLMRRGLLTSRYDRSSRSSRYLRTRRYFKGQPPPWASPLIAPISGGMDYGSGRRARITELHARLAQRAAAREAQWSTSTPPTPPMEPVAVKEAAAVQRCRFCRYELDPVLHHLGYHPTCCTLAL